MDPNTVINIIDPNFETVLKCNCAEDDHYPLLNLTAKDPEKRNLGFMAYRVVKPPIELEFNLMCCIELVSIKIWPKIDSLKSTGFEIFVKGNDIQLDYQKIGSHFNLKENGIQFMNLGFTKCNVSEEIGFVKSSFYHSVRNQLRKVKNVKIVIKQTAKCVPIIKRIEILGTISKFAPEKQKLSIQRLFRKIAEEKVSSSSVHNEVQQLCENSLQNQKVVKDNSANVPEVFLDAITYEIMSMPIILPSGKIIDSSTLEKHNRQEEKWGRSASDPFTGQMLTDTRKPIFNDSLKAQIDAFLLKNSSNKEFGMVSRTVGTVGKRKLTELEDKSVEKNRTGISDPDICLKKRLDESCGNATLVSTTGRAFADVGSKTMDDLIQNVLNGRKYTIPKKYDDLYPKCFQCSQQYGIAGNFYKISLCSHYICRYCLIEHDLKICKCGQLFGNNNVIKYHGQMIL